MAATNCVASKLPVIRSAALSVFIFMPPAFWSALNGFCVNVSQPDPLGLVNLRDLRIMDNHLHHAIAQRADLLADNVQPSRFFTGNLDGFNLVLAHF